MSSFKLFDFLGHLQDCESVLLNIYCVISYNDNKKMTYNIKQ